MSGEGELWISRDEEPNYYSKFIFFWGGEPTLEAGSEGFISTGGSLGCFSVSMFPHPILPGTKKRIEGLTIVEEDEVDDQRADESAFDYGDQQ